MKFLVSLICLTFVAYTYAQSTTKIHGFAPSYIGDKVELYAIEDYFSYKEKLIASATVKEDSTFKFVFFNDSYKKVVLKSNNNSGFIYIQPKGNYEIYFPPRDKYDEFRPLGNKVEISFINLDSTDINYKILSFERWKNNFFAAFFHLRKSSPSDFYKHLDTFKLDVQKAYVNDSSYFFNTYVKFSIAEIDDAGPMTRFQKYGLYLKNHPVVYDNDIYMGYLDAFYKGIIGKMPIEQSNKVYMGVLKGSPTIIANAMANEITLRNAQLLELIMIKSLSDAYFKNEYPQTNILSVLDSVAQASLFKENGIIAMNLKEKLLEILPGSKANDFVLNSFKSDEKKALTAYLGKHIYIQFIDLSIQENRKEAEILKSIYKKYKEDVVVITVIKKEANYTKEQESFITNLPWDVYEHSMNDEVFKRFKVQSLSNYVLIDAYGYLVQTPALKPTPNGEYKTIDESFFYIKKMNEENKKD